MKASKGIDSNRDHIDRLVPSEQSRIVRLLIDQVVVSPTRVDVHLLFEGFTSLVAEMRTLPVAAEAA